MWQQQHRGRSQRPDVRAQVFCVYTVLCINNKQAQPHFTSIAAAAGKKEGWWQEEASRKSDGPTEASQSISGGISHHAQFVDG